MTRATKRLLRRFKRVVLDAAWRAGLISDRLVVNGYTVPRNWAVKVTGYRAATAPEAEIRKTRFEAMMDEYDYRRGNEDGQRQRHG